MVHGPATQRQQVLGGVGGGTPLVQRDRDPARVGRHRLGGGDRGMSAGSASSTAVPAGSNAMMIRPPALGSLT